MKAYDMSRYQRVIGTDGRISGKWVVLSTGQRRKGVMEYIVNPIEVTIYDEARRGGCILYPADLTVWVEDDGTVRLPHNMIAKRIRPEVAEVLDELVELLRLIVQAFIDGPRELVPASPNSGTGE